ncbi:hypothetical protein LWE61_05305 [Sphingobium sufflavum]|uniref:hypothetical protein n=1 Tax=Sphingobium sufflavum TaxID=1129547 RepID=UPI001F475E52|nr:hypothetical protein [Sphingobium sufflavum]MCE7795977.1 hypothetical protein [Sphingobium sufflavum]
MLNWLTDNVSVFKIQHNAHHEFHMSVEQHLLHRARIGDAPLFLDPRDRDSCIARDTLWELRVILSDGASYDLAGPSLEQCIRATKALMTRADPLHLAA